MYSVSDLNQLTKKDFVAVLGGIFEDTPNIAAQTCHQRPFADFDHLFTEMVNLINAMSETEQLALIKAHPDLGARAKMAPASVSEQAGVGLDRLTPEQYNLFQSLNQRYKDKFGFPFIIAVKNHTLDSILQNFQDRLLNSPIAERETALAEIIQIAKFRLQALVK